MTELALGVLLVWCFGAVIVAAMMLGSEEGDDR